MPGSKSAGTANFIRYNPERIDFTITEDELTSLRTCGQNNWKDFFIVSLSIGIPTIINAIVYTPDPFQLSLKLFLNYLFGCLGIALSIVFGIMWRKTYKSFNEIIKKIETKKLYGVNISLSSADNQEKVINLSGSNPEDDQKKALE